MSGLIIARLVREPLGHFFLIGAVLFGIYSLIGDQSPEEARDRIVVTEGRVQQLAQVFTKASQRPTTSDELRGLIDAFVKEEVYYREALKLGLDRDDKMVRRRMQQKLQFLSEPAEDLLAATDVELETFLGANKATFRVEPKVAFHRVFINPDMSDEPPDIRAKRILEALLTSTPADDKLSIGDSPLLPPVTPLSPLSAVARNFGDDFVQAISDVRDDEWVGPVSSPFGLHLVRVTERVDGYDPKLGEVRDAVVQKWRTQRCADFQKQSYDQLRAKYDIVLSPGKVSDQAKPNP